MESGLRIGDLDSAAVLSVEVSGQPYRVDATASGDFNGDGFDDLALLGPPIETFPGELVGLFLSQWHGHTTIFGGANLGSSIDIVSQAAAGNYSLVPRSKLGKPGDLDGDGIDEMLLFEDPSQGAVVFSASIALTGVTSSGTVGLPAQLGLEGRIEQLSSGLDMNGDGIDELLVFNSRGISDSGTGHIINGRAHGLSSGEGFIEGPLNIPKQGMVEFTVTGNLTVPAAELSGSVRVQLAEHQLFLTADGVERAVTQEFVSGDVDGDGIVNMLDFQILATNFGKQEVNRKNGDLDGDGVVTFSDFLVLSANFNRGVDTVG